MTDLHLYAVATMGKTILDKPTMPVHRRSAEKRTTQFQDEFDIIEELNNYFHFSQLEMDPSNLEAIENRNNDYNHMQMLISKVLNICFGSHSAHCAHKSIA